MGSYGEVIKCYDVVNKRNVALKILKNRNAIFHSGLLEITMMKLLDESDYHDELVVKMYDHFMYESHLCIVEELLGPSLLDIIQTNTKESQPPHLSFVLRVLTDILNSLVLCGENNIIHCDLKPENILMAEFVMNEY